MEKLQSFLSQRACGCWKQAEKAVRLGPFETREKNSPKTGKTGQPGAFYLLCDLYNRDRYAGSSTGTGGNIRKHSEKDRRKYSGFPEMDRQCIRKQSGSCEMGAVS